MTPAAVVKDAQGRNSAVLAALATPALQAATRRRGATAMHVGHVASRAMRRREARRRPAPGRPVAPTTIGRRAGIRDPMRDPMHDPMRDPGHDPVSDPTHDPTHDPMH
ncbi:MAG: hypothetical protein ACRYGG_09845, partial [Janthinobacterium lividum]